jgi:hypothetical protein
MGVRFSAREAVRRSASHTLAVVSYEPDSFTCFWSVASACRPASACSVRQHVDCTSGQSHIRRSHFPWTLHNFRPLLSQVGLYLGSEDAATDEQVDQEPVCFTGAYNQKVVTHAPLQLLDEHILTGASASWLVLTSQAFCS